jgi:hypothetical protein
MALHYDKVTVLLRYRQHFPDTLEPTAGQLAAEDAALFAHYDHHLEEQLPLHGIAVTRTTKSRVLMLALVSEGQGRRTRTRKACRYYARGWAEVRPMSYL